MSGYSDIPGLEDERWRAFGAGDYLDRWPIEKARLEFAQAGRVVDVAAEVPGRGWVMLWHDGSGHSVSYVSQGSAGTGCAMALPEALEEFKQALDALLFGLGKG